MSSLADLTPGVWNVDPVHSSIGFVARHLMISKVRGTFEKFNGTITSKNELIVGEAAHIDGNIHVGRIAISGTVVGKIKADQRVEIHRNGKVYSDIDTPALIIEEGAIFQGNCVMGDKKSANVTNIAAKA